MKLSEAIRLGAMLRPQVFGVTADDVGTCALGGALEAIGRGHLKYHDSPTHWPVAGAVVVHPVQGYDHVLFGVARSLNDEHRWTREQIADWVETIEQQQDQPATPVAVEV